MITLKEFADSVGVTKMTAWRWFRDGRIPGRRAEDGTTILIEEGAVRPERRRPGRKTT